MREEFINKIKEILTGYGFNESNSQYERVQFFTQPGQQMIINGQSFNQPDKQIEVKHIVIEAGDGYCSNIDDTNKQEFTQFDFKVYVNNQINGELNTAYYWDDVEAFKKDLQNILKV
jgi:hypothetical protein